jgi:hypothetical protein
MKEVQVKHIITPELIKSLYEKSRTLPPAEAKRLIDQCKFFSSHMGEYLVKKNDE